MEKRTPTYDLSSFKAAAAAVAVTVTALRNADELGFATRDSITAVLQTMERAHFYKSMTSYGNHKEWQDVYHVPYADLVIYIKFVADVLTEFKLLSFKER